MSSTPISAPRVQREPTTTNPREWLQQNLFNGWFSSMVTVVLLALIVLLVWRVASWILTTATWTPVVNNLRLFWVGRYPAEQTWRIQVGLAIVLLLLGLSGGYWRGMLRGVVIGLAVILALLALPPFTLGTRLFLLGVAALLGVAYLLGTRAGPRLRWVLMASWLLSPFIMLLLLRGFGGSSAMPRVETGLWGGLVLTILLALTGIIASFPLGILLALGRRSRLPVVKGFCVAYIEIIRGVPLISVLFMAMIMLPLFLPANVRVDAIIRVMVAITLFSAAYLAENVRGGLQSIPNGQVEAARALGLNVFQSTLLIVLPQALRNVIPAIVGQFISLFKDTSLVYIVGLLDLLGIANAVIQQPDWVAVTGGVQREVLLFTAFIYWVFCFTMSRVSRRIEANLGVGTR
jgi:general L-amino acid transport system permease protein